MSLIVAECTPAGRQNLPLAILEKVEDPQLAVLLMLSVAYGASIGGIGTPIGASVGFLEWMRWGVPVVLCLVPVAGWRLARSLNYRGGFHLPQVGRWQTDEKRVLLIFALTALAWEPLGGWTGLTGLHANDASVALAAAVDDVGAVPGGFFSPRPPAIRPALYC